MKKFINSVVTCAQSVVSSCKKGIATGAAAVCLAGGGVLSSVVPSQAVVTLPAGVSAAFTDVTSMIGLMFDAAWPVITAFTVALVSVVLFKKLRGKVF